MGFLLAGNGLLVIFITIMVYKKVSILVPPLCIAQSNLPTKLQNDVLMPEQIHAQCSQLATA